VPRAGRNRDAKEPSSRSERGHNRPYTLTPSSDIRQQERRRYPCVRRGHQHRGEGPSPRARAGRCSSRCSFRLTGALEEAGHECCKAREAEGTGATRRGGAARSSGRCSGPRARRLAAPAQPRCRRRVDMCRKRLLTELIQPSSYTFWFGIANGHTALRRAGPTKRTLLRWRSSRATWLLEPSLRPCSAIGS
jgi:hypothetical protein